MKKNIRLFGDKDCRVCGEVKTIISESDVVKLNENVNLEILDIKENENEWKKVMNRTDVYYVPHLEFTWEENGKKKEIHFSYDRDFITTRQAYDITSEVVKDDYKIEELGDQVETRERLKSLMIRQEMLFSARKRFDKYFTNIVKFINIPNSMLEK